MLASITEFHDVGKELTLIRSRRAMHEKPSTGSHSEAACRLRKMEIHCCRNVEPVTVIANRSLTCEVAIISATADVKPEDTGPDTKLMRKPSPSTPMSSSTSPVRKFSRMAFSTTPPATWKVSSDEMAVGPAGTARQPPSTMYTKQPRNEPYSPYCGGSPAMLAYASDCGITVNPTVMPAIRSPTACSPVYCGSHDATGSRLCSVFRLKRRRSAARQPHRDSLSDTINRRGYTCK